MKKIADIIVSKTHIFILVVIYGYLKNLHFNNVNIFSSVQSNWKSSFLFCNEETPFVSLSLDAVSSKNSRYSVQVSSILKYFPSCLFEPLFCHWPLLQNYLIAIAFSRTLSKFLLYSVIFSFFITFLPETSFYFVMKHYLTPKWVKI